MSRMPAEHRFEEERMPSGILGVHVRAGVNQDLRDVRETLKNRLVEHRMAVGVRGVYVGAGVGKDLHDLGAVAPDRLLHDHGVVAPDRHVDEGIVVGGPHVGVEAAGHERAHLLGLAPPHG